MDSEVRPPAPHGASPEGPVGGAKGAFDFVPEGFDWRTAALETVRKYPLSCVLGAAAVGFLVGRHRGKAITAAVAGVATNALLRQINKTFETEEF
ncbi:hypothetical protein FBQ97_06145 [Acidobacteria bacterium ACD]|nr:MAG: hypothetical protein EDX89_15715 [Acidobacteriota bacterium]MCE7958451.1 hypothetical protein [Acidobacteria bacterium ACB2]MDL1949382.1 hypothetical protein [Acidobacteria bacterium ACD]